MEREEDADQSSLQSGGRVHFENGAGVSGASGRYIALDEVGGCD